jgi:NAD(P)-dependent dehydrogenase (short-subunit alcohol dehydrogenase family)
MVTFGSNEGESMDLGLKGRRAIVCASSRGLGRACAMSLAREGCVVIVNGVDPERVQATAREIAHKTGAEVTPVAADISTREGRQKLLEACPAPDILVNNNAGPQLGNLGEWDEALWRATIEANMLAPIFLIKAALPGMRQRKFGRIVNITSALVKSPRSPFGLSAAARAGLTALSKAVSRRRRRITSRSTICCRRASPPTASMRSRSGACRSKTSPTKKRATALPLSSPHAGSVGRRSSATPAPISAVRKQATFLGRICWWTVAPTRDCSN